MKPGAKTSEFYFAAISAVVLAVIGILVGYNVLTQEQAGMWNSLAVAVIPLAIAAISVGYGKSRQGVKEASAWQIEQADIRDEHAPRE